MRLTTWIGARTIARYNRIMELSGGTPHPDAAGAYVSNLIDRNPHDRDLVAAAIDQARNDSIRDDELLPIDDVDRRNAPEID